jgi:hypothetical protein
MLPSQIFDYGLKEKGRREMSGGVSTWMGAKDDLLLRERERPVVLSAGGYFLFFFLAYEAPPY